MRLTIPLTQRDIDTVLINGGNHDGSRLPVIAEFSKGKSNEELGEYLKDIFRGGNGFYIDEREVSSKLNLKEDGMIRPRATDNIDEMIKIHISI